MSSRNGAPIDFQAWAQNQIVKRTEAALKEHDAAFAERHAETPLLQLVQYLRRCADTLKHSPSPNEVDGGDFIEQRLSNGVCQSHSFRPRFFLGFPLCLCGSFRVLLGLFLTFGLFFSFALECPLFLAFLSIQGLLYCFLLFIACSVFELTHRCWRRWRAPR